MIIALFATDQNGGMGKDNALPWPFNKEDLKWFKDTTEGQVVVMGRRTWDSEDMPKPLPKRKNVVFTNEFFDFEVEQISGNVCDGLIYLDQKYNEDIFVIGGANLLLQAAPVIRKAFITKIPGTYNCDTSINLDQFLSGLTLISTKDLGTCTVEEYEAIQ